MPDITDCYFCGSIDDPLESYPVVPPETDPPESLQRSVVLCPTCRQKLDRVMEPVREHVGARTVDPPEETEPSTQPGTSTADSPVGVDDDADPDAEQPETVPGAAPDAGEESGTDSESTPVELPDGTGDVVRLLRNREFPVQRAEIEAVAANAYERSHGEVAAVLDALVASGRLREESGKLYRD